MNPFPEVYAIRSKTDENAERIIRMLVRHAGIGMAIRNAKKLKWMSYRAKKTDKPREIEDPHRNVRGGVKRSEDCATLHHQSSFQT